ncbi:hypothetical protein JV197_07515, partial [Vibrio furnissii]
RTDPDFHLGHSKFLRSSIARRMKNSRFYQKWATFDKRVVSKCRYSVGESTQTIAVHCDLGKILF